MNSKKPVKYNSFKELAEEQNPTPVPEEKKSPQTFKLLPDETVLPDDYPMYAGYLYIIDGVFSRCLQNTSPLALKKICGYKEIRRLNIFDPSRVHARLGDKAE